MATTCHITISLHEVNVILKTITWTRTLKGGGFGLTGSHHWKVWVLPWFRVGVIHGDPSLSSANLSHHCVFLVKVNDLRVIVVGCVRD